MKTIRIILLLLMPIFIFAAPAESQPPQDPGASTQEDLRQSIDNLTKVTTDLAQVVNALAENSQSTRNPNGTENWLRIVVPIILAIIGAVAWLNRKIEGFEKDIQRIDESINELKTEIQELKADIRDLTAEVHDLGKGLQTVIVQSKNTDKWIEDIKMDIREIRSEISLLRGQKPDDMPKIEGES